MALTPSFTITPISNPASFTITDTSTGSDGAITDRTISLYTTANALLVGIIDFPLSAGSSITISPLTQDVAVTIVLNWNNNVGTPLYTANGIFAFVQYAYVFLQNLTQFQIANQNATADTNWLFNKFKLFGYVKSALLSISTGQSVGAAQSCILEYQGFIANTNFYF
jgi:hypothetical protein